MKRALALLIFVLPLVCFAQTADVVNSAGCFNAVGYTSADSLGEGPRACGNGTNACNVPMTLQAGSTEFSVVNTPGIPFPNTACAKSLQFAKAGVSSYLLAAGSIPMVDTSSTGVYDETVYLYVSVAPPASATLRLFAAWVTGSTFNARVQLNNNAGQLRLQGTDTASSNSAFVNINASTWYRVDLHGQNGASACWFAVSATDTVGAHQTFTCNTSSTQVRGFTFGGTDTSASGTVVYGNWKVKTQQNGSTVDYPTDGPGVYFDFENSTDGTALTTTILTAGIKAGGVGVWSGTSSSMTVATACEKALTVPVKPNFSGGSTFNDVGSTRGIKFDLSTATASHIDYSLNNSGGVISIGYWFQTSHFSSNDSTDGFYSDNPIETASGTTDFVSTMLHGGLMYLETAANTNGAPDTCTGCVVNGLHTGIPYAANTWYWITVQFVQNGEHQWAVYDASGNLLGKMTKASTATTAIKWIWALGRLGDTGGNSLPPDYTCTDDAVIDYLRGTWPLTPQ